MGIDHWTLLAVFTFILVVMIRRNVKYRNFPPGPWGVPLLGYVPFLGDSPHQTLLELGRKYGSVFSISLGIRRVVILNDYESIQEALVKKADAFSGRPHIFAMDYGTKKKDLITALYGDVWKEQRRFTLQHLRNFGFGKTSLASLITCEVDKVIDSLNKVSGQTISFVELLLVPVINVIWGLSADRNYGVHDKVMLQFKNDFNSIIKANGPRSLINILPMLRYICPDLIGFTEYAKSTASLVQFLELEIERHKNEPSHGQRRDLIDAYLEEITRKRAKGKAEPPFDEQHLLRTIQNLFMAGTDTSATTLQWAFLMMALRPDIQAKVHRELDDRIGENLMPSLDNKHMLPYVEATIMEVSRCFTILPLSVPHATTKAVSLAGYRIPKDTLIFPNLWAVHNNEKCWDEPTKFRPERFLDEDGNLKKSECLIPFSIGARACLGEPLAKMELFLFFSSLMHKFRFEVDPNGPKPSLKPKPGIIMSPEPFSLKVTKRHN